VTTNVNIKLFTFKPKTLEVPVGTTVVWTNGDAVDHTVTSGTPEESAGTFDSGPFAQGKTFSFTFKDSGNYTYYCKRHDFMRGEVKVVPAP
jgi:plastocyanin